MAAKAQLLIEAVDMTHAAVKSVDRNLQGAQQAADKLTQSFQKVLVASGALTFGASMVNNAMQAEQASNRLDAVLRATGKSAGFTKDQLDEMADSLAGLTQFDDESIRAAEATLLKFGNVTGNVFREGLSLAADYASFMGTDVADAAQTVGKALASPTEGLTALERQIGKIAPEQEAMIKRFMEQGRVAEAQAVVLDILRGKIGGTAEVMNTGLTGATKGVEKAWGELLETMGKTEAVGGRAERGLRGLQALLNDIRGELEGKSTPLSQLLNEFAASAMMIAPFPVKLAAGAFIAGQANPANGDLNSARMQGVYADAYGGSNITVPNVGRPGKTKEQLEIEKKLAKETDEKEKWRLKMQLEGIEEYQREVVKVNNEYGEHLSKQDADRLDLYKKMQDDMTAAFAAARQEEADLAYATAMAVYQSEKKLIDAREADMNAQRERQLKAIDAEARRSKDAARDLGIIFVSAAEQSLRHWKGVGDLVKSVAIDVAQMMQRRYITAPLASGIESLIGNLFGGGGGGLTDVQAADGTIAGFASGGSFRVGGTGGTDSQRVAFRASPDETVTIETPSQRGNGGAPGVTVVQNLYMDSRTDRAEVMAMMRASQAQVVSEISEMIQRGSKAYQFGAG